MIRVKFEVEEQEEETPLSIESENDRSETLLSLKIFGNNLNNVGGGSTSDSNNNVNNNVCGTLKLPQKSPEKNGVVVVPQKKTKLDNSTTNSVVAVCSKSIKTEPVESSLSLTTQLNNSLNIQSLLRQNRIQNGWTTNEQSIPIGTQQQQQQSLFMTKIESIFPEDHQEVSLLLDQSSSSIANLNLNSGENNNNTANCDITTTMEMFPGHRAGLGRRAKLNVCYSVPKEAKHFTTTTNTIQMNSDSGNLESTNNNDDNYSDQYSGFGLISGFDPSTSTAPLPLPEAAAVPLLVGKKPLPLGVPPLTLEEKKTRQRERSRLRYHRQKANPEVRAEIQRRSREYQRKLRQQLLATGTPEQLEQKKLKQSEYDKRQLENETEEQRQRRLERMKHYDQTVRKQRRKQLLANATPEQREQIRLKHLEEVRRQREKETEEQRKRRLERKRQYNRTVRNQRRKQKRQTLTPEERETERENHLSGEI